MRAGIDMEALSELFAVLKEDHKSGRPATGALLFLKRQPRITDTFPVLSRKLRHPIRKMQQPETSKKLRQTTLASFLTLSSLP